MSVRSSMSIPLLAAGGYLLLAAAAHAQPPADPPSADALPDLGDPLVVAPAPTPSSTPATVKARLMVARMDLNTPVSRLCADPRAKAVLDADLPGLTTRPEYPFFKSMSLNRLKKMSHGQMTDADLAKVQAELLRLDAEADAEAAASLAK